MKHIIILLSLCLISCINNIKEHGIILKEEDLNKLRVGISKQFIVKKLLGPPSIETKRDGKIIWLYIHYKKNKKPLRKPELTTYLATELIFSKARLLAIHKYNLDDIKKIAFNPNITKPDRKKHNIFKELLGNIGRFDGSNDI